MIKSSNWVDFSHQFSNKNIKAVFSYKSFPTEGLEGRHTLAKVTGFNPETLIIPNQTHSTNVTYNSLSGPVSNTDGIFTNDKKRGCSIQVADCMPVYFVHKTDSIIGLVHAGWRGLVNGILSQSASRLKDENYSLFDFDILIGPSIQQCCFEVGGDVVRQFDAVFVQEKENGKYRVDLQKMAVSQLIQLGFKKPNITVIQDCTFCENQKYHSYRRNGKKAGRMIGLLGMK